MSRLADAFASLEDRNGVIIRDAPKIDGRGPEHCAEPASEPAGPEPVVLVDDVGEGRRHESAAVADVPRDVRARAVVEQVERGRDHERIGGEVG